MTDDPHKDAHVVARTWAFGMDRDAARQAVMSAGKIGRVLPPPTVSGLAQEVISRLAARVETPKSGPDLAQAFAETLMSRDDAAATRLIMWMLANDIDIETIYLVHIAGAARLLGERWSRDEVSAADVSIAATRVYAILRGISSNLTPTAWPDGRHAVFASVPEDWHTLGVSMAADLFRHDGWAIDLKVGYSHDELLTELEHIDFAILGLSASTRESLPALLRLIAAVRVSHPHVSVVIAGHLVELEPDLQKLTDADAVSNEFDTLRAVMNDFADSVAARAAALHT